MSNENDPPKVHKFLELFEEGKRFTESILQENERLRLRVATLKKEREDIEQKFIKVDVAAMQEKIQFLEYEVIRMRLENQKLSVQFTSIEEENQEFAEKYVDIERQNSNLINMYVASYRLHSTLDYNKVLSILKEIIINLVGAESFGIYILNEKEKCMMLIADEGLEDRQGETLPLGAGFICNVVQSGETYVADLNNYNPNDLSQPMASIPLKVGDKVMGAIVIYKLLIQKEAFKPLDFELFELLGGHAATAIYGAQLFTLSERKRNTLEGFVELIRSGAGAPTK